MVVMIITNITITTNVIMMMMMTVLRKHKNETERASTNFLELGFAVVATAGCGFFLTLPLAASSS